MIDKGTIIQNSLLRVGENKYYNDNASVVYKKANDLLDNIIKTVSVDTSFLFNARTEKLTKTGSVNINEEYLFNVPTSMVSIIRTNPMKGVRLEGEFFVSRYDEVDIQYCREITLIEYPIYMQEYMIFSLCVEICRVLPSFIDRLQYMEAMKNQERDAILAMEGIDILTDDDKRVYSNDPYRHVNAYKTPQGMSGGKYNGKI